MYKDELIPIHPLLIYLMRFLTDSGASDSYFEDYKSLRICPHHIHRTKVEHKYAILLLAHGISRVLAEDDMMPEGLSRRMEEVVARSKEECYWLPES